ncbi:unnamed protein product [Amoebophrya sp. A120]|nr:unnamed protein product [Amoebophrya sp. A120]|eukprot:GSA120T00006378001.1
MLASSFAPSPAGPAAASSSGSVTTGTSCTALTGVQLASTEAGGDSVSRSQILSQTATTIARTTSIPAPLERLLAAMRYRGAIMQTAQLVHDYPADRLDLFDKKLIEASQNPSALAMGGIVGLYAAIFFACNKFGKARLDRIEARWSNMSFVKNYVAKRCESPMQAQQVQQSFGLLGRSLTRQVAGVVPSLLAIYVYGLASAREMISSFVKDRNTALGVECSNLYFEKAPLDWRAMKEKEAELDQSQ